MNTNFTSEYLSGLVNGPGNFDPMLVKQLEDVKHAPIASQAEREMDYVRLARNDAEGAPILYVPGFTEGIIAKAPFGLAMAERGADIIIPDQNRDAKPSAKDSAKQQAWNYLAVIKAEGLEHTPVNIVAHSYGAMIFAQMAELAHSFGWTCFDEARVALIAPAGQNADENYVKLGARFAKMLISEQGDKKEIPDFTGLQLKAGQANIKANVGSTVNEVRQMNKEVIDYGALSPLVGKIGIFGFRDDKLFRHKEIEGGAERAMEHGASYAVPIEIIEGADGQLMVNPDLATHNDEHFNPTRVANALTQFFDPKTH